MYKVIFMPGIWWSGELGAEALGLRSSRISLQPPDFTPLCVQCQGEGGGGDGGVK